MFCLYHNLKRQTVEVLNITNVGYYLIDFPSRMNEFPLSYLLKLRKLFSQYIMGECYRSQLPLEM